MRIVLDAMGGDLGPRPCVEGALAAVQNFNFEVIIVGKERHLKRLLSAKKKNHSRIHIVNAEDVVTMADKPRESLRKRNSSLAIAVNLVKKGEGAAVVSPTNTGAFMAHAVMAWRNLPGIKKPAIATTLPTRLERVAIVDSGAVVDCKPQNLIDFAIMGSTYAREVMGRPNPRVGLLSNGEEETKGNEVVLETHKLLRKAGLNFIGNAEGRDIFTGEYDVIVCDGFVGNVVLKTSEGLAVAIVDILKKEAKKAMATMVGGILAYPAIAALKKKTDYDESGGAPLLGVNGIAIITHGSSNEKAIMNALRMAADSAKCNLVKHLGTDLVKHHEILAKAGVKYFEAQDDDASNDRPHAVGQD